MTFYDQDRYYWDFSYYWYWNNGTIDFDGWGRATINGSARPTSYPYYYREYSNRGARHRTIQPIVVFCVQARLRAVWNADSRNYGRTIWNLTNTSAAHTLNFRIYGI